MGNTLGLTNSDFVKTHKAPEGCVFKEFEKGGIKLLQLALDEEHKLNTISWIEKTAKRYYIPLIPYQLYADINFEFPIVDTIENYHNLHLVREKLNEEKSPLLTKSTPLSILAKAMDGDYYFRKLVERNAIPEDIEEIDSLCDLIEGDQERMYTLIGRWETIADFLEADDRITSEVANKIRKMVNRY